MIRWGITTPLPPADLLDVCEGSGAAVEHSVQIPSNHLSARH